MLSIINNIFFSSKKCLLFIALGIILKSLNSKNHKTLKSILEVIFKSLRQSSQVSFGQNIKEKNIYLHTTILGQVLVLDIRLNENNIPKPGEEPINAIDQLAYIHDLAYQKSDNIEDCHRADREMINGLKSLTNLSIPQRAIRAMIIKLFQAKIKL